MSIKYELLKTKRLEYIIFLGVIRIFLEFFDISLRHGRMFFIPSVSAHTLFLTVSLILLCAGGYARREGMCAFGVGGTAYVYFYFIIIDILTYVLTRELSLIFYIVSSVTVFASGVVVLSYMFGKASNKTAKIASIIACAVSLAYSVYAIISSFFTKTLLFSDLLDFCSPLMFLMVCLDSRESRY